MPQNKLSIKDFFELIRDFDNELGKYFRDDTFATTHLKDGMAKPFVSIVFDVEDLRLQLEDAHEITECSYCHCAVSNEFNNKADTDLCQECEQAALEKKKHESSLREWGVL